MNAVPFDTLKMAQRLEAAGFAAPQAAGAAEALAEALTGADLATKGDINALRSELKGDISSLRSDIELLRRDMTIRLGRMMVLGFGALAVIIRIVPPHP